MRDKTRDVAIIGMACIFPKAPDLSTFWENIVNKVDAISDPPPEWGADLIYDPDVSANDRIYTKRGGYLGDLARFNPLEYGVMPRAVDGSEPEHFLALRVAHEALADAGYLNRPFNRERTAVILGRGTYVNRGYGTVFQYAVAVDQTIRLLGQLHPEHSPEELAALKRELKASLPPFNAETAPGLVPSVMCGRIANRLDLMGPAYAVDAACASSLIAIDLGMAELLSGKADMVLAGGIQVSTTFPITLLFCQLNALSRSGQVRPFHPETDGALLGEGVGVIALKRRADAERDGDRIYAHLKAVGTASDGRALGVLAPRVEGEELAMRRAYEQSGISPSAIGLLDAHGTGTPVGDATELEALSRVFGQRNGDLPPVKWLALGSVKSMIGHTIPAAGVAGVIKTALALYHKALPPTLHAEAGNPKLDSTPLYLNSITQPWIHAGPEPRRAAVSAFGFGGINAHAILEEHESVEPRVNTHRNFDSEVFLLAANSQPELLAKGERLRQFLAANPVVTLVDLAYTLNCPLDDEAPLRLAIVATSLAELDQKLAYALRRLGDTATHRIKERSGIYFFREPLGREGTTAFLFPGEGSQYVRMLSDLCLHFPEVRAWFDLIDRAFVDHQRNYLPSQAIFPPPTGGSEAEDQERLWRMDCGTEAVFTANQALFTLLSRLELRPRAILGHSTGEYSALNASGALQVDGAEHLVEKILALNGIYENLRERDEIPEGSLLAVGAADRESVLALVAQSDGHLLVAMDNCPHQIVLFGTREATARAAQQLAKVGAICNALPFDRAYHTPLFSPFSRQLEDFFRHLEIVPPEIDLYSCATARLYPRTPDEIRKLAVEQWARPVRFRETVEAMYEDGVRIFIEVGPKGNLTAFVDDILRGKKYLAVPSNVPHRSGVTQLNHMIGLLSAQGVLMKLDYLYSRRSPRRLSLEPGGKQPENDREKAQTVKIAVGLPILELKQESVLGNIKRPASSPEVDSTSSQPQEADGRSEVMREYFRTMEQFLEVQREVTQAFITNRSPGALSGFEGKTVLVAEPVPSVANRAAAEPHFEITETARLLSGEQRLSASESNGQKDFRAPGASSRASAESVTRTLLQLVSEKTGYPNEALNLELNLEADLGIDSIKRIEILGALQHQIGLLQDQNMEHVSSLKTLREIINFLMPPEQAETGAEALAAASTLDSRGHNVAGSSQMPSFPAYPFIGTIVSEIPNQELIALRHIDLNEDIFLRHHTLGGSVSGADESLTALPVAPLTISMEMLAEAAAMLITDKPVVGMKNIRAHRWIAIEKDRLTLQLIARRKNSSSAHEVEVKILESGGAGASEIQPGALRVEGTVVFGESFPDAPPVGEFPLRSERSSRWTRERLYAGEMFHGPCFQGVVSVDRWGEDGTEAMLKVLPTETLFQSTPNPQFITDPLLLDAAGQLVGYWTTEHLERGFHVFPFNVEALRLYGPNLRPGEIVKCRARIALVGAWQIRSDIDLIGPDGRLLAQLIGWEDKRFDLPEKFYRFRISPRDEVLSTPWAAPLAQLPEPEAFCCCLLDDLSHDLLESHGKIWQHVLAHLVLGQRERKAWRALKGPEKRRTEWLLGRTVAKDAIRLFLKKHHGIVLCPADIEIAQDEHGQPCARGSWTQALARAPFVSLAHSDGVAIAVAGDDGRCDGIGVDIERIGRIGKDFESAAFTPEERNLLFSLDNSLSGQWPLRFWCAKEAVAKALGQGLIKGPRDLVVRQADVRTAMVKIGLSSELAQLFAEFASMNLAVNTVQEDNLVVATALVNGAEDGASGNKDLYR